MNHQVYEEATEWLIEFRTEEADGAARGRFEQWLSRSPEHVRAYLEVSGIWESVSALPSQPQDVTTLIERAKLAPNVIPLGTRDRPETISAKAKVRLRRRAWIGLAAALVLAIAALEGYSYAQRGIYTTALGERRSILLPDGSTIDLNARSKVRVRVDTSERHVDLLQGQALFRVEKDKTRPFVVEANGTQIRALGTRFDVNQRKRRVIVTVVEGAVAVSGSVDLQEQDAAGTAPNIVLAAGEQAIVQKNLPAKARRADVVTATAWTQRRLIFDSTPLDEVAEEFNRNNERPLVVAGEGLYNFHVSGAFSSTDPQPLLKFLAAQPGIRVSAETDRIVITWAHERG